MTNGRTVGRFFTPAVESDAMDARNFDWSRSRTQSKILSSNGVVNGRDENLKIDIIHSFV